MTRFLKSACIILCTFSFHSNSVAQLYAEDWTKNDCSGNSYHLFQYLDEGDVVMLDFVHVGCLPCVIGTTYFDQIFQDYNISHPGRVNLFLLSYDDLTPCIDFLNWGTTYSFPEPKFINNAATLAYYGNMGMPTIVVLGGNQHKIYYLDDQGFSSGEDPLIRSAIDLALDEAIGIGESQDENYSVHVYPQPSFDISTVDLKTKYEGNVNAILYDATGRIVSVPLQNIFVRDFESVEIPVGGFPAGIYFLVISGNNFSGTFRIVRGH